MRFRLLNRIYAALTCHFWLPCRICGQYFGGHEWHSKAIIQMTSNQGEGVCTDCRRFAYVINEIRGLNEYKVD